METPRDVLDRAILRGIMLPRYKTAKPGQVVLDLRPEDRKKLAELKSEDLRKLRLDAIMT